MFVRVQVRAKCTDRLDDLHRSALRDQSDRSEPESIVELPQAGRCRSEERLDHFGRDDHAATDSNARHEPSPHVFVEGRTADSDDSSGLWHA